MDKLEILKRKLSDNFKQYEKTLLKQEPQNIYLMSYETAIKGEISNYIEFDILSPTIVDKLLKIDNPLEFLYQEYLNSDTANICNELTTLFESL